MVSNLQTAYISYTSGSTGIPKGVCIPHQAVQRLVSGEGDLSLDQNTIQLFMAPLAFDASTLEIWGPLLNSGCLVIMTPQEPSLSRIGSVIRDKQVNSLWLTATIANLMIEPSPP